MRLIDADALIEQMEEDMEHMEEPLAKMFTGAAISDIKHAPTVEAPDINVGNMDTISRQQAFDALRTCYDTETVTMDNGDEYINYGDAVGEIEQLPSAQPERPTGEWIQKPRYEDDEYPDAQPNLKCPFCGYEIGWCDMGNYCARCGADLKGGAE